MLGLVLLIRRYQEVSGGIRRYQEVSGGIRRYQECDRIYISMPQHVSLHGAVHGKLRYKGAEVKKLKGYSGFGGV